jgi:hypothetical protein
MRRKTVPIPETILKQKADAAFIAILDDWQEEAAMAIDSAKMELVSHTPPIFKTATWIGLGLSSVTDLAPVPKAIATVADIISKHSMHIFAVNAMVSGLHAIYKDYAKKINSLLGVHYTKIKKALIYGTKQLEALYPITPLAKKAVAQVVEVASRRQNESDMDDKLALAYLKSLILEGEILDTKDSSIGDRIQTSVTDISRKVKNVYEGSKFGFGWDSLYTMDYSKQLDCGRNWIDPFTGQTTSCHPSYNLVSRGGPGPGFQHDTHNSQEFDELLVNIWKYDVQFKNSFGPHDYAYARINPNAKTVMQVMEEATNSNLEGSKKRLLEVEPEVWNRVMKVSKGQPF